MVGIYKIASPSNKTYIGQSIDIKKRFRVYRSLHCTCQIRLYSSFKKYGVSNHIFVILEECIVEDLNKKERYWQDYYNCTNKNGLNCILTGANEKPRVMSEKSIKKMIASKKGQTHTDATKKKMSIASTGRKHTTETKEKLRMINLGKKLSQSHKDNIKNKFQPKKVIDMTTNIIYNSVIEASDVIGIRYYTLASYLNGNRTNKTTLKYLDNV